MYGFGTNRIEMRHLGIKTRGAMMNQVVTKVLPVITVMIFVMLATPVQAQQACGQHQMQVRVIQDWAQALKTNNPPAYIPQYHFRVPGQEHRVVNVAAREICRDGSRLKTINRVSVCYDAQMNDPDYFSNGFCFDKRQVTLSISPEELPQGVAAATVLWIPSLKLSQQKDQQNYGGDSHVILAGTEGNFLNQVNAESCVAYRYDIPKCQ